VATLGPGVGNVISANTIGDYNTIQAKLAKVLGPPTNLTPRYGYNQLVNSSQVSVGNKVTLSHWTNLRSDMIRARGHQSGSASESNNLTLPTNANLITEAIRQQYFDYATLVDTYRDTVGPGQYSIETAVTAQRIDDWNGNLQSTVTMNFGDNNTMRAFFNAGGLVKFNVGMTGTFNSFSTVKDNTWTTMFSQMGTITFDRDGTSLDQGSSGTTTATGFFALTNSYQPIFTKSAPAGVYPSNQFIIYAQASNGTLIFAIQYNDITAGASPVYIAGSGNLASGQETQTIQGGFTPGGVGDEYIDGIITQTVVIHRASGSYVSIASPTTSLTGDFINSAGAVYGLSASKYAVNEGDGVVVTLQTRNVANGTFVTYRCTGSINYTVNGITNSRFSAGSTDSYFTVNNNTAQISFTVANNYWTDGITSFNVELYNGLGSTTITINDTSTTPIGNQLFSTAGQNTSWTAPTGVRSIAVAMVGGGGGGGNFAGGGGGAGQFRIFTTNVTPGASYALGVASSAGVLVSGSSSVFSGNIAFGGNPGTTGSQSGHGGTMTGGNGGQSGAGAAGGTGSGSTATTTMTIAGGGGAGSGYAGNNASANTGGRGGDGYAFTYQIAGQLQQTLYVCGGGGGGGVPIRGLGVFGGGNGGGSDQDGATANTYGSGGGGGGAVMSAFTVDQPSQRTAVFSSKTGGGGAQGFVWVFWPASAWNGSTTMTK
jgi:hypothetical protein